MTRVLVCSGRIGSADPLAAGRALAAAFADAAGDRVQLAVVPVAGGGPDLEIALDALGAGGSWVHGSDAEALGRELAAPAPGAPGRRYVDLTGLHDPDPLPALLTGLGSVARGRALLAGTELIGVLAHGHDADLLLGVEGVAARQGFERGTPAASVLARDAELARLADSWGVPDAPGVGAAGGAALAIAALGGRLATGFALCRAAAHLDGTLERADLLVAGTDSFTIGDFGGPVVLGLAPLAGAVGVPVLAVARTADISVRELRRHGVEAVHALGGGPDLDAAGIAARVAAVARSWTRDPAN